MFLGETQSQKGVFRLGGKGGGWLFPHVSKLSFHMLSEGPLLNAKSQFDSRLGHELRFRS